MLPVKIINRFLKNHTFTIKDVFKNRFGLEGDLNFKIEIYEVEEFPNIICFDIKVYCLPSSTAIQQIMDVFFVTFGGNKIIDSEISESRLKFLSYPINDLLENFLKHFSIENVFLQKIIYVNHMTNDITS